MQLKVTVWLLEENVSDADNEIVVRSFRDVVRIGAIIARQVREWLRAVPMTPHPKQFRPCVTAEWVEAPAASANPGPDAEEPTPKRKRKAKKGK